MRIVLFIFFLSQITTITIAQKHDYNWVMGYENFVDPDPLWGGLIMDFHTSPPSFHSLTTHLNFRGFGVSFSDSLGKLLFYSNGIKIHNAQHQLMENGDTINPSNMWESSKFWGSGYGYGGLAIPIPGKSNNYYMFHLAFFTLPMVPHTNLYYSEIDMNANSGNGRVVKKNVLLAESVITPLAVKHGNGRDWWLITGKSTTSIQYVFLIDSVGIHGPMVQDFGPVQDFPPEGTLAHVSPDGSRYIRSQMKDGIRIYDFNRCTGALGNLRFIPKNNNTAGGVFSPDSRMVYLQNQNFMGQVDMMQLDTSGFIDTLGFADRSASLYPPFYTSLGFPMHAPDGKIYLGQLGTTYKLHVINRPDFPGAASDIQLNGVNLPRVNAGTTFNLPFYRLGEWESSPCDTINLQQDGDGFYSTPFYPEHWTDAVQSRRNTVDLWKDNARSPTTEEGEIDPFSVEDIMLKSIQSPPPTPWEIEGNARRGASNKKTKNE